MYFVRVTNMTSAIVPLVSLRNRLRGYRAVRHVSTLVFQRPLGLCNRLLYAVTNEYPHPLLRKLMIEETTKKIVRVYLKELRRDIGRTLLIIELVNLEEAEKKAANLERYSREERQANCSSSRLPSASNRLNNQSMQVRLNERVNQTLVNRIRCKINSEKKETGQKSQKKA